MLSLLHTYRRPLVVVAHLLLAAASNFAAYLLRFDFAIPPEHVRSFLAALPLLLTLRGVTFYLFRLYEGLWRYVSLSDLERIVGAVLLGSTVFGVLVRFVVGIDPYPRSVIVTDSLVLICLLGGVRSVRRVLREFRRLETERRAIIVGAGDAGELLLRDMRVKREYNSEPVGFVDDDPAKVGQSIHGLRVLGTRKDLATIIEAQQATEVIVAMPSAPPEVLRTVVESLQPSRIAIRIMPRLSDVVSGQLRTGPVRELELSDLMTRRPVGLDDGAVHRLVSGRRVLVTGAGGSIGSELCRQIASVGPSSLVLVDRYENTLFELLQDLAQQTPGCPFVPVVADVTDADRIELIFQRHQPEIVFHAAAHKHVPLMEQNPVEAVKNNVRGTRLVAEAAARHQAHEFVLISTDKAVNPSSVMGATKRVAEMCVRSLNRTGGTRFVAVRFGNVLGSHGSVTTVFEAQIKRGGPVTVTHPEIRRFFMLIPEAVNLVLHAAAARQPGMIYALDMGEPIRVADLARNLIRLAGFVPEVEIPIQFVGLRPGEKLYEELADDASEVLEPSELPGINRVRSLTVVPADLAERVARLEATAFAGDDAGVLEDIRGLVPSFREALHGPATKFTAPMPRIVKGGAVG